MSSIRLIRGVVLVAMLAVATSCGVTTDNQSDQSEVSDPSESTETATQPETQLSVPQDLQLISPLVTCKAPNACVPLQECRAIGRPVTATCPSHLQCCTW